MDDKKNQEVLITNSLVVDDKKSQGFLITNSLVVDEGRIVVVINVDIFESNLSYDRIL